MRLLGAEPAVVAEQVLLPDGRLVPVRLVALGRQHGDVAEPAAQAVRHLAEQALVDQDLDRLDDRALAEALAQARRRPRPSGPAATCRNTSRGEPAAPCSVSRPASSGQSSFRYRQRAGSAATCPWSAVTASSVPGRRLRDELLEARRARRASPPSPPPTRPGGVAGGVDRVEVDEREPALDLGRQPQRLARLAERDHLGAVPGRRLENGDAAYSAFWKLVAATPRRTRLCTYVSPKS